MPLVRNHLRQLSNAMILRIFHDTLLQENEEDGEHKADERRDVVPVESLAFEEQSDDQGEDHQRDNLLDHF